jgi:DNA-binding GntR family transcriptional regulator
MTSIPAHATIDSTMQTAAERQCRLDRSRHAAPQVVEYLRDRIIALDLVPGALLSRNDLAAQFGLSQTPVRDALMRLEEEGLVDIFPQHKTVVSRIDIASAAQAQFLRRSIELEVVRTLAQARDATLVRQLRATIARQKALLESADFDAFAQTDQGFHRHMYAAADVPDLWETVRRQSGHVDRLRRLHLPIPGKTSEIVGEHTHIVDAIARGNVEAAERCVRKHLSGTMSHVKAIRDRYPGYVTN